MKFPGKHSFHFGPRHHDRFCDSQGESGSTRGVGEDGYSGLACRGKKSGVFLKTAAQETSICAPQNEPVLEAANFTV